MNTKERMARAICRVDCPNASGKLYCKDKCRAHPDSPNLNKRLKQAEAVISDLSAAGSAIVPREPTEEMRKQGTHQIWLGGIFPDRAIRVYKSMVAASEEGK